MTQIPAGEVLVCETPEGDVRVDVRLDRDTVWLRRRQVADLFNSSRRAPAFASGLRKPSAITFARLHCERKAPARTRLRRSRAGYCAAFQQAEKPVPRHYRRKSPRSRPALPALGVEANSSPVSGLQTAPDRWIFQIPEYGMTMELKPQDLLVLLKRAANSDESWTYGALGEALGLSASQVHRSVRRAAEAGLAVSKGRGDWDVVPEALVEFAVHGARYAFPAKMGAIRRGVPTSFGAPPLSAQISAAPGEAPVWPSPEGQARGPSLSPLYRHVPEAALADPTLYELLALLDALRAGRSRERTLAQKLLSERLRSSRAT